MKQYELLRKIDDGGMGMVFEGRRLLPMGQCLPIAIKIVLPRSNDNRAQAEEMFKRETLVSMQHNHKHENLVTTYDAGISANGYWYLTMELVHGVTLATASGQHRLAYSVIRRIARDVLSGLSFLHSQQVIHRDIKPSNILLSRDGTVRIADFGLVKQAYETGSGCFRGTLAYASPESLQGYGLTERADLYSLGLILYELVSGSLPYREDEPRKRLVEMGRERVATLPEATPSDLVTLIEGLIEIDIEQNSFATAEEAITVLDSVDEIASHQVLQKLVAECTRAPATGTTVPPDLGWPFEDANISKSSISSTLAWTMVPLAFTLGLAVFGSIFDRGSDDSYERNTATRTTPDDIYRRPTPANGPDVTERALSPRPVDVIVEIPSPRPEQVRVPTIDHDTNPLDMVQVVRSPRRAVPRKKSTRSQVVNRGAYAEDGSEQARSVDDQEGDSQGTEAASKNVRGWVGSFRRRTH